ncbi:MAG: hypothetical protein RI963_3689 [Planctomycetota bacterium]
MSPFEDADFCRRVLARAEANRRREILAKVNKDYPPVRADYATQWKQLVETIAKNETRGDRRKAATLAAKRNPKLRQNLIAAANSGK